MNKYIHDNNNAETSFWPDIVNTDELINEQDKEPQAGHRDMDSRQCILKLCYASPLSLLVLLWFLMIIYYFIG